jgi:putative DNA primase/helicase
MGVNEVKSAVTQAANEARKKRNRPASRSYFRVNRGYVERQITSETEDGKARKKWVPFITELRVEAVTRNADGQAWGRLLTVVDRDGREHAYPMPSALLANDCSELRATLTGLGLEPAPGADQRKWKDWLRDYIWSAAPAERARCVDRVGWHGSCFVLPDETIGESDTTERVILQSESRVDHSFGVAGSLDGWKADVASRAVGNSRLMLFLSAAFASPLLSITGDEGGGIHLRGGSSLGKSTALVLAGSVWGGGAPQGYVRNWRTTDNGLEAVAGLHNATLLCLDELSQVEPRAAGAAAYMLANGQGKSRAGREGQARRSQEWRLLFGSTGEIGLADKIREGGGQIAAGMEVRVIDLRADAGTGLGLFEDLHGAPDAATFAQEIKAAANHHYGHPAREFLRILSGDLPGVKENLEKLRRDFVRAALTGPADGQVRRVADRFGLVAAAGELATNVGITGWPPGEAVEAALTCFHDWLTERGGTGSSEVASARQRLAEALENYGASRFQKWHVNADRAVITPRWGFVKVQDEYGEPLAEYEFFLTTTAIREILAGLDFRAICTALVDQGVIVSQGPKEEANKVHYVPNGGVRVRLYQIDAAKLGGVRSTGARDGE